MYGLVLEGGGARGAYQAGVYQALVEHDVPIKAIVGTSIGALNGALMVQGDLDLLEKLWKNLDYSMVIEGDTKTIKKALNDESLSGVFQRASLYSDGLREGWDISPFRRLLNEYIDEDRIRRSPIKFGLVTTNVTDYKPTYLFVEDIPEGMLSEYLVATAALPVFESQTIAGKKYVDGAFVDNLPFKMIEDLGLKPLLVRIYGTGIVKPTMFRRMETIEPIDDLGDTMCFEAEQAKKNMRLGYFDGLRFTQGLIGKRFYFKPIEEKRALQYFLDVPEEVLKKVLRKMNLSVTHLWQAWLCHGVSRLGDWLGVEPKNYTEVLIAMLEYYGDSLHIDRFKIYTVSEFLQLLDKDLPVLSTPAGGPLKNVLAKIWPEISKERGRIIHDILGEIIDKNQ